MPYYAAGDYYRGDGNYAQGDFLGIGGALKKVARAAVGLLPGPAGVIGRAIVGKNPNAMAGGGMKLGGIPQVPEPGVAGAAHRFFAGGHTGYGYYNKKGEFIEGKRPRMNVGNIKALRRANRRAHGFLKAYRSAVSYFVAKHPKGKPYVHFKKKRA